jgi:uncharacterized protein YbjQ (UPF0145 family)
LSIVVDYARACPSANEAAMTEMKSNAQAIHDSGVVHESTFYEAIDEVHRRVDAIHARAKNVTVAREKHEGPLRPNSVDDAHT